MTGGLADTQGQSVVGLTLTTVLDQQQDKASISITAPVDSSTGIMLSSWAFAKLHQLDLGLGLGVPTSSSTVSHIINLVFPTHCSIACVLSLSPGAGTTNGGRQFPAQTAAPTMHSLMPTRPRSVGANIQNFMWRFWILPHRRAQTTRESPPHDPLIHSFNSERDHRRSMHVIWSSGAIRLVSMMHGGGRSWKVVWAMTSISSQLRGRTGQRCIEEIGLIVPSSCDERDGVLLRT